MGMDIGALIECRTVCRHSDIRISNLEQGLGDLGEAIAQQWIADGRDRSVVSEPTSWVDFEWGDRIEPPKKIALGVDLRLRCGFRITFGKGGAALYYPLRLRQLVECEKWQRLIVAACKLTTQTLEGTKCLLTCDNAMPIYSFLGGMTFENAMETVKADTEVGSARELECWLLEGGENCGCYVSVQPVK